MSRQGTKSPAGSTPSSSSCVLQSLGYGVNFAKSALTPSRTVDYLGLCWDSEAMTVALPKDKVDKIVARADQILAANGCSR